MTGAAKIKLGVSACLLGNRVRYDGGHRRNRVLAKTLGKRFELVPVCPEVEAGLSIPREPMELFGSLSAPRLRVIGSTIDLTGVMTGWAGKRIRKIEQERISGFLFKNRSPSCAVHDAGIAAPGGRRKSPGLFRSLLLEHIPHMPVADEEELADPLLLENFVERVLVHHRWQDRCGSRPSLGKLVSFHSDHKLLLMAHSLKHYSRLGRLVAGAKGHAIPDVCGRYIALLMEGLRATATPGKHANVLQHIMGYFKSTLSSREKEALLLSIDAYRREEAPLAAPLALIKRHLRKHPDPYLLRQAYLDPGT